MQKVVIITGFTGSGKSGLAIKIAKKYNGEIISCDSVQIYRGLDIGSAKVTQEEMQEVRHHLIDILDPSEDYSVGQFVKDCKSALDDILSRGKLPILVGGTGLYIKALLEGYNFSNTDKNDELRRHYLELSNKHGSQYIWDKLYSINPDMANKVHPNNTKRVIRYLEIAESGNNISTTPSILSGYNTINVGIIAPRDEIYNRINLRVDDMIRQGLEQEVRSLLSSGISIKNNCLNTIGYREMTQYIMGEIDIAKSIELIKQHTRNYCKRQLTFMKTINNLQLVDRDKALQIIEEFLDDNSK